MSTPPIQRPRRSNANLRPADILLQDKRTRCSPTEVALEKATLEAQRKAMLEQREADLWHIAALEQRLEEQDRRDNAYAGRPPSTSLPVAPGKTLATAALPASGKKPAKAPLLTSGCGSVLPTPLAGTGSKRNTPKAKAKGPPSARMKRATRFDVEPYRAELAATTASLQIAGARDNIPSASGLEGAGFEVPVPVVHSSSKRKSDVALEDDGLCQNEKPPKKGKPVKRGGVTVAAATEFSNPPAQVPAISSTASIFNANSLLPLSIDNLPVPAHLTKAPKDASAAIRAQLPKLKDPSGIIIPAERVTQSYGGYIPDDDEDHDGKLLPGSAGGYAYQSLVKVELTDPATVPSSFGGTAVDSGVAAVMPAPGPGRVSWSTAHVDQLLGALAGNYAALFVPKLINLTGNSANGPWKLYGLDLQGAMKDLAEEVWPQLDLNIVPRQPFYEVSKQRLSEYRNGIAKEAIDVVKDRASYITWALGETYPFRYIRIVHEDDGTVFDEYSQKNLGAYQGTLVARTFAYHIQRIKMRTDQIRDWPCNALALSTTAVERALKMWSTGSFNKPKMHSEEAKFSDRLWGRTANEYLGSITNLDEEQWDAILDKADRCARGIVVDSEDESDEDSGDYIPNEIPTTGGRATMEDHWQRAREAYLRGTNLDGDVSMDDAPMTDY
ncbi:hypothetical protein BC628DRAFT_1339862 [Trametes gibbosa]|nr:hypothetical protein BC628DRAFT_1339862 [Trametes gibbosa]